MRISSACKLPDLAYAMVSNLDVIIDSLDEVGITKSIGGVETEFTRWVNAFAVYSTSEFSHVDVLNKEGLLTESESDEYQNFVSDQIVISRIGEQSAERVMGSVESVLEVLQQEVPKGILIPRIKGHLELKLLILKNSMVDHTDLMFKFGNYDLGNCSMQDCLPELNSSSESEAREVWLSEWLEENKVL